MTQSTSNKTLNHNTSGSKTKPQKKSNKQALNPIKKGGTNKAQKPTTSPKTATSQEIFSDSTKHQKKTGPMKSKTRNDPSQSTPTIKTLEQRTPAKSPTAKPKKPTQQQRKKFFIKPKQSIQQGQSINTIMYQQQVLTTPNNQTAGRANIKRLFSNSSSFIRKITAPHNVLFLGFLLCSSAILGYIMSSLVKFQMARGNIGPNQPTLGIANLSDFSLLAGSDEVQSNSGLVATGIDQTGGTTDEDIVPSIIETVIAPNRKKTVSDLVQGYYKAIGDDSVQMTQRITPGLNNRTTYQQYFNPTRVARFKAGLTIEGLRVQNISIVANKNQIPTQILYELNYTRSSNAQTYTEQRRVDLRNTTDGLRIGRVFCETKGCSRHPFYGMR